MFKVGDKVSYGLHGKCIITSIESKLLGSETVHFYQIRTLRNSIGGRTQLNSDTSILVPVSNAELKGLRFLMSKEQAEQSLDSLTDPEISLEVEDTWVAKQKALEEIIRKDGFIGLVKSLSYLHQMIQQDAVPPSEVTRFFDSVFKIFAKEVADSLEISLKDAEKLVTKALNQKVANS